jgi:nitroimidazol reductase NimA-like FMN-containing flavoprotein (pyridoxamine 5'-phosphate oxidase superfamily)
MLGQDRPEKALIVKDMSRESAITLLQSLHEGRIACVRESQPYITPLHFAYQDHYLYSFATVGKRIEWMRANPLVCVEVERIESRERWHTIIVSGVYEELPNGSEYLERQVLAYNLLSKAANWWEPGFVKTIHQGAVRPLETVYFRIKITEMSAHEASVETAPVA